MFKLGSFYLTNMGNEGQIVEVCDAFITVQFVTLHGDIIPLHYSHEGNPLTLTDNIYGYLMKLIDKNETTYSIKKDKK